MTPSWTEDELECLRHILSATPDAISLVDRHYIYRIVSDAFLRRSGKRRQDVVGRSVAEVMGEAAFTSVIREKLDRCLAGETIADQLWFTFAIDGRRLLDVTYCPYRSPGGSVTGVVVTSRDITAMAAAHDRLAEKERQLAGIADQIPGLVFQLVLHPDGGFSVPFVSAGFETLTEIAVAELATHPERFFAAVHPEDMDRVTRAMAVSAETLEALNLMYRLATADQGLRWFFVRAMPAEMENGDIVWNGVTIDISDRVAAEKALEESRNTMAALLNAPNISAAIIDVHGRVLACNPQTARSLGIDPAAITGADVFALLPPEVAATRRVHIAEVIRTGRAARFTDTRAGRVLDNSVTPLFGAGGQCMGVAIHAVDITEHHRMTEEQRLQLELLRIVNSGASLEPLIQAAVGFIREWSGVEAVGIRLRQGDDYPYFETSGFAEDFVRAESRLCAFDPQGRLLLDAVGNPVLECMCGNILQGRFDPALPFFTQAGSFWTNSTSRLLASTSDTDRQARTRNRCHGEGYESVALVPLRVGDAAIGLIQLNDRRPERFDPDFIRLAERMADHLAVAVSQRIAETALKNTTEELREINTALRVLLKKREEDTLAQESEVSANVRDLVRPYLEKLKASGLSDRQKALVGILEQHTSGLSRPFARKLATRNGALTPALIQVADLIKQGLTSKEMATTLGMSVQTIHTYRKRLRERLDIKNKSANLQAYLLSLD